MNINPGIEIIFEGNKFRHCKDENNPDFDTYVLKSTGNILKFTKEGFSALITTIKFPHGLYGYGYSGTALRNMQQCYCHGKIGNKTFKTEFEAQCEAIKYVLRFELPSDWNRYFIRLQMNDFINPKTLF
jgi:hypothetical protein